MTAPNSLFFQVLEPAPLANVGWEVRVLDRNDFETPVAVVPDYVALRVGLQLSAPGAGSITIDLDSPFWNTTLADDQPARALLEYEYLWEAWEDGILRFQWLGRVVEEKIVDDSEANTATISGPGAGEILRFAVILPPGFPLPPADPTSLNSAVSSSNNTPAFGWEFPPTWPGMRMWYTLWQAAQSRGTITWIKPLFTATHDSGGQAWEYVPTTATVAGKGFRPKIGQDLLNFLDDCTGQENSNHFATYAEWILWPGGYLDVRKEIGSHREDKVIFWEGGLRQKHRTRTREDIANYIVVTDVYGAFALATDSASQGDWNRREALESQYANVTDPARRDAIAQILLTQRKNERSEWVIRVPYDEAGRRPFIDYHIGDWIGVATFNKSTASTVDAYRVLAITVSVTPEQTVVELTLQSILDQREKIQQQIEQIVNEVGTGSGGVGSGPGGLGSLPDVNIPPAPGIGDYLGWDGTQWTSIPAGGFSSGGSGIGFGVRIFIQPTQPAGAATGDLWLEYPN